MRKSLGAKDLVVVEGGYLLSEIFADNYEYEEYFKLINAVELNSYFPSQFEVEFEEGGKAPRLKYPPDRPEVVVLVIPITKKSSSPKKKNELRHGAFQKYGGLIPKIRLEMKDELAMRKRVLVPASEKNLIDQAVEQNRRRGLRKVKKNVSDSRKSARAGSRQTRSSEE